MFTKINKFYTQVKQEIRKISWPTNQELFYSVLMVFASVFFVSFIILLLDYSISKVIIYLLKIGI
ncbi:MAG: preprotein translocase subunit SecE [Rickettsiaceae bacterium]|nr:preprotein translocase subunit SecE [Rickettsiaceae bacterium]